MTTGTLRLVQGSPNPNGAGDAAVYLFCGDATAAPITEIIPAEGVQLPPSRLPLARPVRIKLLHFNDLHGHIAGFTAQMSMPDAAPRPLRVKTSRGSTRMDADFFLYPRLPAFIRGPFIGQGHVPIFSRLAAWLRATRARYADDPQVAVLAVSAGDDSGGAIFDELLGRDPETYQVHAGYRLYSEMGVDLGGLGNHDLDRGALLLAHAIRQETRFPILAANLTGDPALAACCCPAALVVVKGVRVGFIGLTTPAQIRPEPHSLRRITDPVAAVHNLIPALRPLCDVLIILSHLGYSLNVRSAVVRCAGDVELARSLPPGAVHLIVGGHTHNALNETGLSADNIVNGVPIVQAGKFGQFVGEVDITVQQIAAVTYARLRATIDLPVDEAFEREHVRPLLEQVRPYRERIIGRAADDEDLSVDAVCNAFAAGESALANFIADALVTQARAHGYPVDFALVDASNVGCGLRVGADISFGDWFDLMPFADTLCLYRLSGQQLDELLQDNAQRMDRPDQPHTERGFLHFSGQIHYAVEFGPAPGQARAVEIRVNSRPIKDSLNRTFLVACSSFLRGPAAAWEEYARRNGSQPVFDLQQLPQEYTQVCVRDLLVDAITAHGGVLPEGGAKRDGRLRVLSP
ncbi:MAG: 5'-nucleotidase C-terminal domain-containing protein [Chloroflexi bacterium]|nr:5'-nucleotidase C-terminal domain-containing protein [Chloroflexota bacterium]